MRLNTLLVKALLAAAILVFLGVGFSEPPYTEAQSPEPAYGKLDAQLWGLLKAHRGKAGFAALPVDSPYKPVSTDVLFQHSEAVVVTAQGETFVDALIVTNGPIDSIVELGVTIQSVVGRVVSARMPLVCGDQNGDGVLTSSMPSSVPRSSLA